MRNEKGFTLIELVVVIVILGILAAVAVPKFVDMQVDARESAVNGMLGAVRSATALAHAKALVDGATGSTGSILMEGTTVALVWGYPSTAGIAAAVTSDGFDTATAGEFRLDGAPDEANCMVAYTQATDDGGTPPTMTAVATSSATVSGCQ